MSQDQPSYHDMLSPSRNDDDFGESRWPTARPSSYSEAASHNATSEEVESARDAPEHMPVTQYLVGADIAHYHILGRIGGGAMTVVFRANDTVLDRTVALKVLLPGADTTMRERFRREARTAAMLEHPNIVRTYQVGQVSELALSYIAMELVNGPSLADLLERHKILSPPDVASLLEPIARALAYAHGRGVIHRDVKPSNILLQSVDKEHPLKVDATVGDGPFVPLLSDFGIARALDSPELTGEGRTIGTPAFMSPEQCAGAEVIDGRADIYSLGAVLYRCLVGRPPYVGSTTAILHSHVYDPLLIPSDVLGRLPANAVHVLQRSMMKDPTQRYATSLDLAEDLAGIADDGTEHEKAALGRYDQVPPSTVELSPESGARSTSSHVLVPAQTPGPAARSSDAVIEGVAAGLTARETAEAGSIRGGTRNRSRLGIIALSVALVTLTAMMAITLFTGVLPAVNRTPRDTPGVAPAPTVVEIAAEATMTVSPAATPQPAVTAGVGSGNSDSPTATMALSTLQPQAMLPSSPTAEMPPLQVSVRYAWENAQAFYAERDWEQALDWLVAVQRADPEFETVAVRRMLAETYVGLAAQAMSEEQYDQAVDHLEQAADASENADPYLTLAEAVSDLADSDEDEVAAARTTVQRAYATYAAYLAEAERYCDAADQIEYARGLAPDAGLLNVGREYEAACAQALIEAERSSLSGRIVYSAVEGERYGIYALAVDADAPSQLIIEDASQPSLSPDGQTIAYHSRRPEIPGLVGQRLANGITPADRAVRLSSFVEDARDSAPSWNPQGDRLAYASTNFGDGRSRIYLTWADGNRNTVELGLGKDPAWHPDRDMIVFNGSDETGNNPGLWIMQTDGASRVQLTDNGNDQRPAWFPDGSAIVFMSNGRDGNWELYRYGLESGQIVRLTNHGAQDGLPYVSPDGRHIAFMSDRDGYWRLWFMPLEGGDAHPLSDIAGTLPKWLEHSIQWVR
jgi:serine/threonine protein kinase/Tol biopolymer transport system component